MFHVTTFLDDVLVQTFRIIYISIKLAKAADLQFKNTAIFHPKFQNHITEETGRLQCIARRHRARSVIFVNKIAPVKHCLHKTFCLSQGLRFNHKIQP